LDEKRRKGDEKEEICVSCAKHGVVIRWEKIWAIRKCGGKMQVLILRQKEEEGQRKRGCSPAEAKKKIPRGGPQRFDRRQLKV